MNEHDGVINLLSTFILAYKMPFEEFNWCELSSEQQRQILLTVEQDNPEFASDLYAGVVDSDEWPEMFNRYRTHNDQAEFDEMVTRQMLNNDCLIEYVNELIHEWLFGEVA